MALAADVLGDRWTLLILREAFYGVTRFDDMQADLCAPRSALADRLRRLVDAGLLKKTPYREPGSRARDAYLLSERGRDLAPTFLALTAWGEKHITRQPAPVDIRDSETGARLRVELLDDQGFVVPLRRARLRLRR
ncbi:MAG: helix-turn-helix domain-containing protein [Pseudomonadota bacterium]